MAKIDEEQSLKSFEGFFWDKLSADKIENLSNHSALNCPELEQESAEQTAKASGQTQVSEHSRTVAELKKIGFRRCGGLSEY